MKAHPIFSVQTIACQDLQIQIKTYYRSNFILVASKVAFSYLFPYSIKSMRK